MEEDKIQLDKLRSSLEFLRKYRLILLIKFDAKIAAVFYKFHFGIIIAMVFVAGKKI